MEIAFIGKWQEFSCYCKQHSAGIRFNQKSAVLHDGNIVHWIAKAEDARGIRFDKCIVSVESIPQTFLDVYFSMVPGQNDPRWEVLT